MAKSGPAWAHPSVTWQGPRAPRSRRLGASSRSCVSSVREPGHTRCTCLSRPVCPRAPNPTGARVRNAGERKTSHRQGRPGLVGCHRDTTCDAAGRQGQRPGRAGPPRAPLTGEAAAPLAVPAAPLQDEVAAALLGHPELQRVLEQHLLGFEPHRGEPAAPAGPGSHRPSRRPHRAEPAWKEAAGNCARRQKRERLPSPGAQTTARRAHPALPAVAPPRLDPAHQPRSRPP